jgi:hypothetical protein
MVRNGSWLCKNAKALYRYRRSHSSKTVSGIHFENTFDLEIELKNVILVAFRFFAFSHSQGHSRPVRADSGSTDVRHAPIATEFCAAEQFRYVPILLQKSFWGGEAKFLELLMRLTRGDVRDLIVSPKIDHRSP